MKKKDKPEQIANLLQIIKEYVERGKYYQTIHAFERLKQREIDLFDVLYVLKNGFHEKKKTSFDEVFQKWKYAIRGKTFEEDTELRVIVTIEENGVIIITTIDLTNK